MKHLLNRVTATATAVLCCAALSGPAQADDAPKYGGHLRIGVAIEPTSLDPALGRSGGDAYYFRHIFDQLVEADQTLSPDAASSLAESWEISTEPDAITFKLRQGVTFHDGTAFDANVVKANIDRILDPETKATPRAGLAPITSVDVLGDYEVRFNLSGPWGAGLSLLADRGGAMSSPEAIAKLGDDYPWNPVGTGPFKLAEAVPGSHVRLVRNENYWGTDEDGNQLPYLDEVTLTYIKDDTVMASALKSGEIDIAYLPPKEVTAFEQNDRFRIEKMEGSNITSLLAFNLSKPPMDNVHLRRAIMHAINADAINKAVYFDRAVKADAGMWPVNSWVHAPNDKRPGYSLEKAREELKAGGMPDGFEVGIVTWNGGSHPQAAEVVRALLLQVGIKAKITVLTVGTATEQFFQGGAYPIYLSSWSRYPEPDWISSLVYRSEGYYNAGNLDRPEIDTLIAQGAATYDQAERKKIYQQINDIVLGEAWIVPTLYGVYYAAAPDYVRNIDSYIAWDGKPDVKRIWIDPDRQAD